MSSDSEYLHKEPCPNCGSKNNLARYSDGHGWCFGCDYYEPGDGSEPFIKARSKVSEDLLDIGEIKSWESRGISEDTAAKWGFTRSTMNGQPVRVFNYRDSNNTVIAQKVRTKDKDFRSFGDMKGAGLYGQWLWRDGGKMVVVTEGEMDALSVSQLQNNKWPVVSVPKGAPNAKKALADQMEWLDKFETVVLMFDMDEPGRKASTECAMLFSPGKCKIASLPLKDANDMLCAGRGGEVIDAIWGAKEYRPDGILTLSDIKEAVLTPPTMGLPFFLDNLTNATYGRKWGQVIAFGAGTGVGKTDFLTQQITYDVTELQEPVGAFFLETPAVELTQRIAGKYAGKCFHIPDGSWTPEELATAIDGLEAAGKLYLYDNFGATDWEVIKTTIRFLHHSQGVRLFYLDHLTALAAAETDERTALERIMAEMSSLAKELGIIIHLVSHLSTPDGKPHEEGGRVMIRHFKGSRSIGFWCHFIFGLERDQQHEDPKLRTITTFRVLKDRATGRSTGDVFYLGYDQEQGRLLELQGNPFEDDYVDEPGDRFADETGETDSDF